MRYGKSWPHNKDLEPGALKTLIVDDEPIARRILREYFDFMPGIELIGEAENGEDAVRKILSLKPDLVFLDLRMPVMSGFEVVRNLGSHPPAIVIVTAYDRHAIEAYEAGAIDYLLKPVDEARLHKAVERARNLLGRPDEAARRIAGIAAAAEN